MTTVEPWAAYVEPVGVEVNDPLADLLPPDLARARRAAMLARADEQRERREQAERHARWQDRHDAFTARWLMARRFEVSARGGDPNDPGQLALSPIERADRAFYEQDRQLAEQTAAARQQARRVLADAGISGQVTLNVESPLPGVPTVSSGDSEPPASRSGASSRPGAAARATPIGAKVRAAFDRWATRSSGPVSSACRCAACDPAAVRGDPAAGLPEITRTFYEGVRTR